MVHSGLKWFKPVTEIRKMFKGQYLHIIDSKGRVNIPSKLRRYISAEASNTFVMTQGIDRCVDLYPKDHWSELESKLTKLNIYNQKDMRFIRMMLFNASEDSLDGQSRILIPQNLIEYAGIKNDVLILGAMKKIEIWNPDTFKEYLKSSEESFENIASEVMKL